MKISIIGAGNVGATAAQRIAEADLADIVLVDVVEGKAQAVALDLASAASIMCHSRTIVGTSDLDEIEGSKIIVVTAGLARKPGQSREDLMATNAKIIKNIAQKINQKCINPIIIVVTNPLDVMSHLLFKTGRFQANQVIGMGGVSDCARFNMLVASELETTSCNIQSTIIGAHGDSMLVLPRLCTVSGIPVTDLLAQDKINYIIEQTCNFGAKIVELLGQGSAYYGPAAGIFQLVDAIINDRKKILCASTYLEGQYGLENIFLGIPVKIGRFGIEEIIELDLTAEEKKKLLYSANKVQESIKKLGV